MRLDSTLIRNVLSKGLGFPVVLDKDLGNVVKMRAKEAFVYALVTGSPYLVSECGLVLAGRLTIFYHRDYSFTPGLFNVNYDSGVVEAGDTPLSLKESDPGIFERDKYVLLVDIEKSSNIESDIFRQLTNAGKNPSDYILTKIMPTGSGLEHLCEYIACMLFNKRNYMTESQPPWSYYGNPDFAAYKLPEMSQLWDKGFIGQGCLIQELSALSIFGKTGSKSRTFAPEYEFVVGEAKTLSNSCVGQLREYLETGLCDSAYEIIPHKRNPEDGYGLLSFNPDGTINLCECKYRPPLSVEARSNDKKWLENYIKFYLLANLPMDEIRAFVNMKTKREKLTPLNFIDLIRRIPVSAIVDEVEGKLF